jgi:hypothetical protein
LDVDPHGRAVQFAGQTRRLDDTEITGSTQG